MSNTRKQVDGRDFEVCFRLAGQVGAQALWRSQGCAVDATHSGAESATDSASKNAGRQPSSRGGADVECRMANMRKACEAACERGAQFNLQRRVQQAHGLLEILKGAEMAKSPVVHTLCGIGRVERGDVGKRTVARISEFLATTLDHVGIADDRRVAQGCGAREMTAHARAPMSPARTRH